MESTGDTVEVQLGHPTESYKFKMQRLVLTRPQSGLEKTPVTCNVCGKEIAIFVPSRSRALKARRTLQIVLLVLAALALAAGLWIASLGGPNALPEPGFIIGWVVFCLLIASLALLFGRLMLRNQLNPVIKMTAAQAATTYTLGSLANIAGRHRLLKPDGIGLLLTERQNGASLLAIRISRGEP